jgi:predicted nucleic acid-binding protein
VSAVAIDSSSLIGYLNGRSGRDTSAIAKVLAVGDAVLPPLVVTELLSLPDITPDLVRLLGTFALLPISPGYWERAGRLRARVGASGRRARIADTLIAQSCVDHEVPLITADRDFRHFTAFGLRLHV